MQRTVAAIALVAVLLVGGGIIASAAYQVGLTTAIATTVTDTGATVVVPPVHAYGYPGYGYGPGWGGPGFGIFGFLGAILFLFIIFGLIRAAFFRGGGRRWGGPGGPGGWGGPGSPGYDRWQGRAKEVFDDFHKEAHSADPKPPSS